MTNTLSNSIIPHIDNSQRNPNGTFTKGHKATVLQQQGFAGSAASHLARARRELNADTIAEMHKAFRRGGAQAINKVMRNNPAMFLKMLVLLVPREMEIQHSGGVKAMTTEQIERAIELIKDMIAKRDAAANAKVIEAVAVPQVSPAAEILAKVRRTAKVRNRDYSKTRRKTSPKLPQANSDNPIDNDNKALSD